MTSKVGHARRFVNEALHEKIGLRRATVPYGRWQEVIRGNEKKQMTV